ncbi:hypothetical protein [Actinokineospora bangkokensis]|uniref:Uncharacterized protein n=1 Tax=Actinokineospora bangkokensis TaxID=1193682 RepID=A0A1Q9LSW0_9PSEU|nr:hypothetical protein [Actinokineospora bangkokensis]OLR95125.1 hypothetical protein BJP25_07420 [Actinokineospora bangkokensis]
MNAVFPVGHHMGQRLPDEHHAVRVGWEHRALTADEFGLWVLAHGTRANGRGEWTAGNVVELATAAGVEGPAGVLAAAADKGVVVGVTDALAFTEAHRLHPLKVGLGNTPEDPDRFRLGHPGVEPVSEVSASAFELWQWAQLAPSLRHLGEVRAKAAADLGAATSAELVAADLLADVRELLVSGCAYLDLARAGS